MELLKSRLTIALRSEHTAEVVVRLGGEWKALAILRNLREELTRMRTNELASFLATACPTRLAIHVFNRIRPKAE